MKNPAVLLYTSDFITGTLFMTNEEVGAYIRLLCMQHQKGHLTKNEIEQICKNENVLNSVIIHFKTDTGGLYFNERMDLEKEKRNKYSESRANNRKKKDMKNISKTYQKDMENENDNDNINNNINNNIKEIINYLNQPADTTKPIRSFKSSNKNTRSIISARLKEGFTVDDFKDVIFFKYNQWEKSPYKFSNGVMSDTYYRPETLFNSKNFENYLQEYRKQAE